MIAARLPRGEAYPPQRPAKKKKLAPMQNCTSAKTTQNNIERH
jgi:hypothetical protein